MLKFKEDLLPNPLITQSGIEIKILKQGTLNKDAGPDFFNASLRINDLILVGNIELHLKTSDWLKHKHQYNKTYDNIILHAVYHHDVDLPQNIENNVEILELKPLISIQTLEKYSELFSTKEKLPCANQLHLVNDLKLVSWLERMTIERLETKVKRIENYFEIYKGNYTQVFYTLLLRNFGFNVNAIPFELIAKQLPISILLKHGDNLMQLEAFLLGISGLLENQFDDKYILSLQNEFEYLSKKYQLIPLQKELFKYSKMRPANFPSIRLMQFANLLFTNSSVITNPQNFVNIAEIKTALKIKLEDYWKNHYTINGKIIDKEISIGEASIENLIINTFAPFFFFYSKKLGKSQFADLAIELLTASAFEKNFKSKLFLAQKKNLKSSADSQALINLYDNYCSKKRCLKCGVAVAILK
jgi:hypothetical protein